VLCGKGVANRDDRRFTFPNESGGMSLFHVAISQRYDFEAVTFDKTIAD